MEQVNHQHSNLLTPTEALLQAAKSHPHITAIRCLGQQMSYAALWARVRRLSTKIESLDPSGNPIGLYMNLEIDYVAGAHAIWLAGRTVVFLSTKWTSEVLEEILARSGVSLVLNGLATPPPTSSCQFVSTLHLAAPDMNSQAFPGPLPNERVAQIPVICSITPTSGSTGTPKSIVYPMRRSLQVLTEESFSLLKRRDGQWLRGGTTFLRPLFEIRRFMFSLTTLYLDPSPSIREQCEALCAELDSPRNTQLMRVYFTPSVFRAFVDYVRLRSPPQKSGTGAGGFWRVYWMVIGGESLAIRDLELARSIFPECTIACNYACSEIGFAGVSQMFVRPCDPIPQTISFGPTQGCTDLVLLDEHTRVVARSREGATGIVGIISDQSAVSYLHNEEATGHMFRSWRDGNILLYTDDLGMLTSDGRIVINGRQSRNVKINGLFVDLDYLEAALTPALSKSSSSSSMDVFKLVKSNDEKIILFFSSSDPCHPIDVLRRAHDALRASLGDALALVIHSVRIIDEMPFNASYKVDVAKLQTWANSSTTTPSGSPPDSPPSLGAKVLAGASVADIPKDETDLSPKQEIALEIAAEVQRLCRSEEPIAVDTPLMYAGLNSITVVQLYFWLQGEFEYEEDMSRLFEEGLTAEALAGDIVGDEELEDEHSAETDESVLEPLSFRPVTPSTLSGPPTPPLFSTDLGFIKNPMRDDDEETVIDETEFEKKVDEDPSYEKFQSVELLELPPLAAPPPANVGAAHSGLEYSFLSFLFLSWLTPSMRLGAKRPLTPQDLLPLRLDDEAAAVEHWTDNFRKEVDTSRAELNTKKMRKPSLFKSVFGFATQPWIVSGLLWLISTTATILGPFFVQQLIVAANSPPRPSGPPSAVAAYDAAIFAVTGGFPLLLHSTFGIGGIMIGLKLTYSLTGRACDQIVRRMALNVKTSLISAVYKKSLKLSAKGSQTYSKGYILNLVNVDSESISKAVELCHQMWSIPFQIIVSLVLLSRIIGVSVWAGIGALFGACLLLMLAVPVFMRKATPQFQKLGDKRLKNIREVLDGIKLIKVNAWESIFQERLQSIRAEQLGWLKQFNLGVTCFVIFAQLANIIMPLAAFSLFGHDEGSIPAARIFPAISFFGLLIDPLIALPQLLSALIIAMTSCERVYAFLMADEKATVPGTSISSSTEHITVINAAFDWPSKEGDREGQMDSDNSDDSRSEKSSPSTPRSSVDSKTGTIPQHITEVSVTLPPLRPNRLAPAQHLLRDINISIKKGSLTAIVGNVGSGKSSLLSGLIGEMDCVRGTVSCNGSIAYCAQQPWIQTSTLQDNILFGKPLDDIRLKDAIATAGLEADIETLTHGLLTQIGEKGVNLSGGQKSRVALARAIYSNSDIYLLDDPLSSLDPRVGRSVFKKCIKERLSDKTRVLATHQLQYLSQVDHIIVLSDGTIAEQGSYQTLVNTGGVLSRMVYDIQSFAETSKANAELKRRTTLRLLAREEPQKPASEDTFIVDEERCTGDIAWKTWWAYIKASGGVSMAVVLVVEALLFQSGAIFTTQWLTWWVNDSFRENVDWWIGIYNGIGWTAGFLLAILNVSIALGSLHASRAFHARALAGILNAPLWWLESQPIGRLMNRFSKDIEALDQRLMPQIFQLFAGAGALLSIVVILAYSVPAILALLGPMMIGYYFILRFYRKSLRELKRLESTQRSPLQARVNETLEGIPTIKAYKRERDFESAVGELLNKSNQPTFMRFSAEVWVTLRLEMLSSLVVFTLAMVAKTKLVGSPTQFALALTYASSVTYIMNLFLKSAANVESEMNAVERLLEYSENLPQEPQAVLGSDPTPAAWPTSGEIKISNLTASYHSRPEKPVLRDVNITFQPGETIYICGRTGSGKSSLLSTLLRMVEIKEGSVEIDGRDISTLGVATLRQGLQLIPQDPFLFSGTIRSVLDFDFSFQDEDIWRALDLVGLKSFVSQQDQKLDTPVTGNGENYSVGQRQLFCLASAILRQPKILLLDEATASIDIGSDIHIQQTLRANCPKATIISVMHRLGERILNECDKVLVMDQGIAAEFASPRDLLARPGSIFGELMDAAKTHYMI